LYVFWNNCLFGWLCGTNNLWETLL
jgi:hypothetical protein